MDDQILGVILALVPIFGGILPLILSKYYPFKKSPFQILFINDKCASTIIIRNASPNPVFIDKISLHKSPGYEKAGIRDISKKFDVVINTKVLPWDSINTSYSDEEIKKIVLENYKISYNREYDYNKKCRLGYKITIESSEGNVGTKWFKMGLKNGNWCFYDFMWKRGSYYLTGKCHERLILEKYYVFIVMFSVICVLFASESGSSLWMWISFALPLLCLVGGCLGATDGYSTRFRLSIDALLYSIPIITWIYLMTKSTEVAIFFGLFVFLYIWVAFKKLSGWDM